MVQTVSILERLARREREARTDDANVRNVHLSDEVEAWGLVRAPVASRAFVGKVMGIFEDSRIVSVELRSKP